MYTLEKIQQAQEVKTRLEIRKQQLRKGINPNPYYRKGEVRNEYMDVTAKINELDKIINNG